MYKQFKFFFGFFLLKLKDLINFFYDLLIIYLLDRNYLAGDHRLNAVIKFSKKYLKNKPINFIEVGSRNGQGYTKIFIKFLKNGSKMTLLDQYHFSKKKFSISSRINQFHFNILINYIRKVVTEKNIIFNIVRSVSSHFFSNIKRNTYDVIFIDGSHLYKDVYLDVLLAKKTLKKDGIICGDDLEIKLTKKNFDKYKNIIKKNINMDYIYINESSNCLSTKIFHPGVSLAVFEHFGQKIKMQDGFWWIKI